MPECKRCLNPFHHSFLHLVILLTKCIVIVSGKNTGGVCVRVCVSLCVSVCPEQTTWPILTNLSRNSLP